MKTQIVRILNAEEATKKQADNIVKIGKNNTINYFVAKGGVCCFVFDKKKTAKSFVSDVKNITNDLILIGPYDYDAKTGKITH